MTETYTCAGEKNIPKRTVERLTQLSRLLEQTETQYPELRTISSSEIERLTGWTNHTVRRDISLLKHSGATAAGYDIHALKNAIREQLHIGAEEQACCIVGLGRLGSAFLEYEGLKDSPFRITAGFDSNVNRTEILRSSFPLYPTTRMKEIIEREHIQFAILTVPGNAAVATAQRLAEYGIRGIVNFTPAVLILPSEIEVENVSVADALSVLAARLARCRPA